MASRDELLKKFTQKQLLIYFITNLLINALVPYFGFDDRHAVYLFKGAHPLARFLIPMSVFVPFGITFDILKKTITLLKENELPSLLPPQYAQMKFMLKLAGINAGVTGSLVVGVMLLVHVCLPEGYSFDGTFLALVSGCIAGGLAVFFTLQPLHVVKNLKPE